MERAELYDEIVTHLDFVAGMDEQDHGGSAAARRIREVLIPLCEREGGIDRQRDALENTASELERIRVILEHAVGARIDSDEGGPFVAEAPERGLSSE